MARTQAGSDQIKGVDLSGTTDDVSGVLTVSNGGTGNATNTLGSVLVGNGTGAIGGVAPGTSGNALVSNGSAWTSAKVSAVTDPVFTGNASPTYTAGKLVYDTSNDGLTFYNSDSNVALQIGQENWIRVRNMTGSTIANGVPVYVSGTDTGLPTIAPAKADAWNTAVAVGLTTESIATSTTGWVTVTGEVRGLDTSAYSAGALVYISAATAGLMTATAPTSPNYVSVVGRVTVSNASTGRIHVLQTQPSAAPVAIPADFMLVQVGNVARATGSGDFAVGHYVGRAFTATKVVYQFDTADASSSTTVELRRNGTQVTSSSVAVTAANQVDGTGTDAARTVTINQSFSVGDRINLQITGIGTTPGKGLRAWIVGTWN